MDETKLPACELLEIHVEKIKEISTLMPNDDRLIDLSEIFKVFGDSTRIRILSALMHAELCVCDIATLLNMSQSAISHQLRILKYHKLVKYRRQGKTILYSLSDAHVTTIIGQGLEHINE